MLRIFDLSRRKFVKWNENEDQKASILSMNANLRMHGKQAGVYRGDFLFAEAQTKSFDKNCHSGKVASEPFGNLQIIFIV